jgi:ABC-type branched-subunit amino acid transport system ATPase component
MPSNVLEISDLNVFYGQGHILHDISLQIGSEEAVFILGLNGMGKTALLRAIMGIFPPRSVGSIRYDGIDSGSKRSNETAAMGLGYVPQGRLLFPSLSVEEHLHLFYRQRRKAAGFEWTKDSIYELFPILKERRNISGTLLSGGEQQMLAIARALVTNPTLLIMDEPTEGLSPSVIRQIVETCKKLRETGVAMLLTEQNLEVTAGLADRTLILETGRFVHQAIRADYADGKAFKENLSEFMKI